jgi:hypothetical protein
MNKDDLIKDFLKSFKPKEEQSWKSSYFFTHYLKNSHDIDAMLVEGMSRIKKIDYWMVFFNNENIDIHALAVNDEPDFIDKPDMLWTLEQFEKDNF